MRETLRRPSGCAVPASPSPSIRAAAPPAADIPAENGSAPPPRPSWLPLLTALLAACFAALLLATPASSTSYVLMSDADLADGSPVIAEVRVLGSGPAPATAALPATEYRVEVLRVLKGHLPGSRIAVRVPGGVSPDGRGFQVYGAPRFAPGDRALLFLAPREDGSWGIHQLLLGAFRVVEAGGEAFALRNLSGAHEVVLPGREDGEGHVSGDAAPGTERRLEPFAAWLEDRARGLERPRDYLARMPDGTPPGSGGPQALSDPFKLFTDNGCPDGQRLQIRWFDFDAGGSVAWQANASGQPGMDGGGFTEFQNALAAWENDADSSVRFRYLGTTSATSGGSGDGLIVFDDPEGEIDGSFSCSTGGVLAVGGPSFFCTSRSFKDRPWREAVVGQIITQDGAGCFFGTAGGDNGEEVFAHEVGHTLGLAHSISPGALMRATAYGDGRGARLGSDDRDALAFVYGDATLGGDGGGGGSDDGGGDEPPGPQPPVAPSDLQASTVSTSQVRLTWEDRSSTESRFQVEGKSGFSTFQVLGSVGAGSEAATVTGLEPDTLYSFRVRACNAAGCSSPTSPADARTAGGADGSDGGGEGGGPLCSSDPGVLCLADGRFEVEVDWANPRQPGDEGRGTPIPDSDDSGFFWFFQPGNIELVVKVIDGRPLNGHFWVFYGGLSDVRYDLRVTDTVSGQSKTYRNPAGEICGRGDTEAFQVPAGDGNGASRPPDSGAATAVSMDGVSILEDLSAPGSAGPCAGDRRALCLLEDRFRVTVDWDNPRQAGDRGTGTAVPRSDGSGTFWFFDPDNVELVVKMIDGRPVNGHYWFFYGGLSDVEYEIEVEDLASGAEAFYLNPAGEICGQGDSAAF